MGGHLPHLMEEEGSLDEGGLVAPFFALVRDRLRSVEWQLRRGLLRLHSGLRSALWGHAFSWTLFHAGITAPREENARARPQGPI